MTDPRAYINPKVFAFKLTDEEGQSLAISFGVALWKVFGPRISGVRLEDFKVVWDDDVQELQFVLPGLINQLCYGPDQMHEIVHTGGDMRQSAQILADWTLAAVSNDDVLGALKDLGVVYGEA